MSSIKPIFRAACIIAAISFAVEQNYAAMIPSEIIDWHTVDTNSLPVSNRMTLSEPETELIRLIRSQLDEVVIRIYTRDAFKREIDMAEDGR